jgi:hypothetical protein
MSRQKISILFFTLHFLGCNTTSERDFDLEKLNNEKIAIVGRLTVTRNGEDITDWCEVCSKKSGDSECYELKESGNLYVIWKAGAELREIQCRGWWSTTERSINIVVPYEPGSIIYVGDLRVDTEEHNFSMDPAGLAIDTAVIVLVTATLAVMLPYSGNLYYPGDGYTSFWHPGFKKKDTKMCVEDKYDVTVNNLKILEPRLGEVKKAVVFDQVERFRK